MTRYIIAFIYCSAHTLFCLDAVGAFYDRSNEFQNTGSNGGISKEARENIFKDNERLTIEELNNLTATIQRDASRRKLSNTKIDNVLTDLIDIYPNTNSSLSAFRMVGDKVLVDVAGHDADEIATALEIGGYDVISCYERVCSMYAPVDEIDAIAAIPQIVSIRAATPMTHSKVISEGIFVTYVDKAISKYKVNGRGITIGVLSDSFDCMKQARLDIRTGDLPPLSNINVLADLQGLECFSAFDEGRAMMQLIYDIAPGAKLAFRTASRGKADFANGIHELANIGCDIIVDDIGYLDDAYFQDGIIAQAVDDVVMQGVSYFSAVGNDGRNAWDAPAGFVPSGVFFDNVTRSQFHKFGENRDGSPIVSQRIRLSSMTDSAMFIFQWDQPHFSVSGGLGCRNNVDIFITYNKTIVASGSYSLNEGSDPIEKLFFFPGIYGSRETDMFFDVYIVHVSGARPQYMKLMAFTKRDVLFEFGDGSTIFGHPNAASAAAVGAASFFQTPFFNLSSPLIAPYSSVGGTPIVIDKLGNRQSAAVRKQPIVSGPDGGLTTFFPPFPGSGNRFFGSSAAAPHVAAVAALLLEAKGGPNTLPPKDIYRILQETAVDMDDPSTVGFDYDFDYSTGYGFINTLGALDAVTCNLSWNLFNSETDTFVAPLPNNTVVSNPIPCNRTNIELVVPCGTSRPVVIELYQSTGNKLLYRQTESVKDYFLFSNSGNNVFDGRIIPGTYTIRAKIDGKYSPSSKFTIRGPTC
jgi:subtilisin family serine protease